MKYDVSWAEALESAIRDMDYVCPSHLERAFEADEIKMPSMSQSNKMSQNTDFANNKISKTKVDEETSPQEFIGKLEEKIKFVRGRAATTKTSITNIIKTADRANKEFLEGIRDSEPVESVQLMNWRYGHNPDKYLHKRVIVLRQVLEKMIRDIRKSNEELGENSILVKGASGMEEPVMREIGAPSSITTYREFVSWTQAQFRGRKSELTYHSSDASKFIKDMQQYSRIVRVIVQDLAEVDRLLGLLQNQLRGQLASEVVDYQLKQTYIKRMDRCAKIFIMYLNMITMTYRLHTEYILNRRAVLKRLYASRSDD